MTTAAQSSTAILLVADCRDREEFVRGELAMVLPSATVGVTTSAAVAEGEIPVAGAAVVDADTPRGTADILRVLRARGFSAPIVVITSAPDDAMMRAAADSLGAVVIARSLSDTSPPDLAEALSRALGAGEHVAPELKRARRIFAAGQVALSIQHGINNPLAALMAEAQLLQMEALSAEQRDAVDRMVELCRRIVALVRRLDSLPETTDVTERTLSA
jgi:signal transduction histidine kinase